MEIKKYISLPVIPMPIPRTMSPKMRKMIDLKIKCKELKTVKV